MRKKSVFSTLILAFMIAFALALSGCAVSPSSGQSSNTSTPQETSFKDQLNQCGVSNDNFIFIINTANAFMADSGVHSFASGFGVSGLPHSIVDLMKMTETNAPTVPTNMNQLLNYLNSKNVSTIQNFLDSEVLTRVDLILPKLSALETENACIIFDVLHFRELLTGNHETNTNLIKFDAVEFYAADVILSAFAGLASLLDAQNLDVNMPNMINMMTNLMAYDGKGMPAPSFINSIFYNPFSTPGFGTLRNASKYAAAKTYLLRAADKLDQFLIQYEAMRISKTNLDLIPSGMPADLQQILGYLATNLGSSLNGNSVALYLQTVVSNVTNTIDSLGIKINLGRYLDNAPSLRSLFVELDGAGDPVFYTTNDNHTVTGAINGGVYCLKLSDTNFTLRGLLDHNLYTELTNSSLKDTDFTNIIPVFNEVLLPGGYVKIAGPDSNGIECIPFTNAGYTSQWLNLYYSIDAFILSND